MITSGWGRDCSGHLECKGPDAAQGPTAHRTAPHSSRSTASIVLRLRNLCWAFASERRSVDQRCQPQWELVRVTVSQIPPSPTDLNSWGELSVLGLSSPPGQLGSQQPCGRAALQDKTTKISEQEGRWGLSVGSSLAPGSPTAGCGLPQPSR